MGWIHAKIDPKLSRPLRLPLTPEERVEYNARMRRIVGHLCNRCEIGQKYKTMTICLDCWNASRRGKHTASKKKTEKKNTEVYVWDVKAAEFESKCIRCNRYIPNPIGTLRRNPERKFVKYFCTPCYKDAWQVWRETRVSVRRQILKRIDEWRLERGVLPKTAWHGLHDEGRKSL
jgi:hypothetical protein